MEDNYPKLRSIEQSEDLLYVATVKTEHIYTPLQSTQLQLTTAHKTLTCKYCGKSTPISKITIYHTSHRHGEALDALYRFKREGPAAL